MKKALSILLVLVICLSLCACGGSKDNNNPQVLEAKDSTVRYENYRIEDNIIYLDFNYENRGKNASDIHDAVYIRAFQDGVELSDKYNEDSYTDILSGYNATRIISSNSATAASSSSGEV